MNIHSACVVLLLSISFYVAYAQECKTACELGLTQCNHVNYNIYFPSDNITAAQELDGSLSYIFSSAKQAASPQCYNTIKRLFCGVVFPSCAGNTPIPLQTCSQMCTDMQVACGALVEVMALYLPDDYKPYVKQCTNSTFYVQPDSSSDCIFLNNSNSICGFAWTGACQEFDPSFAPVAGELCKAYTPKTIFVPYDSPTVQADIANRADVVETARRMQNGISIIPTGCYKRFESVLCPIVYPPCISKLINVPGEDSPRNISVAPTICRSFCYEAYDECYDFFVVAGLTRILPGCDNPDLKFTYTEGDTFVQTLDAELNVTVELPCYAQIFPVEPYAKYTIPDLTCPLQTGRKTKITDEDAICGMKCPDASYSDGEWNTLVSLTQAGSAISLICMAFLILSYLVKYEKRRFPGTLHLNEFVATFMFSLSFLLGGTNPQKDVWCYDEGTYATQSNNSTCAVQGFLFIFFGISLAGWCALIAFAMFYILAWKKSLEAFLMLTKYKWLFYVLGWVIPLIFGIAALASERIGYGPPLAWCFIRFGGFGYNDGFSRDYPLFYIPIGVLIIAIIIMFFVIVFSFSNTRRKLSSNKKNPFLVTAEVRVLIFVFVIIALCITIFEWRFQIEAENQQEDRIAVGIDWTMCKIKLALNISQVQTDGNLCPGTENPSRIDFNHTAFESFFLSGVGIFIFIAFGSDIGIYQHWAKIFKHLFNGEYEELKRLVVSGGLDKAQKEKNRQSVHNNNGLISVTSTELSEL